MIISRTPFRISFFGGGTDFPDFYKEHGGAVLSTTIAKYCYISLHPLGKFFDYKFRASYKETESVQKPSEFKHPLIRECLGFLKVEDGIEIAHIADLPGRTGLGTSSSFTVGLLNALHTFHGTKTSPDDLAREAIIVERERVGDAGGHQDQYAAAHGGLMRIDFSGDNTACVKQLTLSDSRVKELESRLRLFYTGISQTAQGTLTEQAARVGKNEKRLLEMLDMVNQAERILSSNDDLNAFGELLHESWQRKKELATGITNDQIDQAYDAAVKAGAKGGKLLGGGGRGFLLVYSEQEKQAAVAKALDKLQPVPFHFSTEGSQITEEIWESKK